MMGLWTSLMHVLGICMLSNRCWRVACRYAYVITCTHVVKEGDSIVEVHAEGRKVKEDEKPPKVS